MGTLRQIGVSVNPIVTIKMRDIAAIEFSLCLVIKSTLSFKVNTQLFAPRDDERNIELIAVERCDD